VKKLEQVSAQAPDATTAATAKFRAMMITDSSLKSGRRLLAPAAVAGGMAAGGTLDSGTGPAVTEEVSIPELRRVTRQWWHAHPALDPEVKYAAARLELLGLAREGDRLLAGAPRSVLQAFDEHAEDDNGEASYWSALGAVRPHLQHAYAELEERKVDGNADFAHSRGAVEL